MWCGWPEGLHKSAFLESRLPQFDKPNSLAICGAMSADTVTPNPRAEPSWCLPNGPIGCSPDYPLPWRKASAFLRVFFLFSSLSSSFSYYNYSQQQCCTSVLSNMQSLTRPDGLCKGHILLGILTSGWISKSPLQKTVQWYSPPTEPSIQILFHC